MEYDDKEMFEFMLENGYIEEVNIDSYNEVVYKMTHKMINDFPEIFKEQTHLTNELVFSVWQKGFIEMTMGDDMQWTIIVCDKTEKYEMFLDELTDDESLLMWEINQMIKEKGV